VLQQALRDIVRARVVPGECTVVGQRCWTIDPAYVVFTVESQNAVEEIQRFLREHAIEPLGRYGRWEYSSMGQVIRDGRQGARSLMGQPEFRGGTGR
jgi:hypothetical protein